MLQVQNKARVITMISISGVCLSLLGAVIINITSARGQEKGSLAAAPMDVALPQNASLDDRAAWFNKKTEHLVSAEECFPVHMMQKDSVNLLYLYCSSKALERDGKSVKVSSNFEVTDRIARRFNFWRRVYSLWSQDQYVLHVAEYPEVVLEVGDGTALWSGLKWQQKGKHVNKVMNAEREEFRRLLVKMHQLRKQPEGFTPAMKRVEILMAHISDPNKYQKAAESLRLQRGQREMIAQGLTTATRYMAAIDEAFGQEGLPPELSKIAFIESSFNLKAYSKVGASGIYQIMPGTGREFMIVNDNIDERQDPIKAAHAAAKIFRQNYRMTGAWPLAITSYNHGPYGIQKAVRAIASNNIEDLIERYDGPAFGFASKNFYCGFLALLATLADASSIFPDTPRLPALAYNEIKLPRATTIAQVRKQFKISNEQIADYNPDIHRRYLLSNGLLPRGYKLKVPLEPANNPMLTTVSLED